MDCVTWWKDFPHKDPNTGSSTSSEPETQQKRDKIEFDDLPEATNDRPLQAPAADPDAFPKPPKDQ